MVLPDDKLQILNMLKSSREFNRADNTPLWRKAFELYNSARGENLKAQDRCSRCFSKVKEWLQS